MRLLAISPFLPDSVDLSETKSTSFAAVSAQRDTVLKELNNFLESVLVVYEDAILHRRLEVSEKTFNETFSAKSAAENAKKLRSFQYTIDSYSNGVETKDLFIDPSPLEEPLKNLYALKLRKLEELESRTGAGVEASSLATIQPQSIFSTTYVLKFKRKMLLTRKYNISFEVELAEEGKTERQVYSASVSLLISPPGFSLNLVVVVSALLGVALKISIDPKLQALFKGPHSYPSQIGWLMIEAAITSLVFFNVYEYTSFSDRIKMALSWRSALLIGVLCGLLSDRILASLQTFLIGQQISTSI